MVKYEPVIESRENYKLLSTELLNDLSKSTLKFYKTDLEEDYNSLKEAKVGQTYIWCIRTEGTLLFNEDFLLQRNSDEYGYFMYYKDKFKKLFKITVKDITDDKVFVSVKDLNINSFKNTLEFKLTDCKNALISITTEDDKEIELLIESSLISFSSNIRLLKKTIFELTKKEFKGLRLIKYVN